MSALRKEGFFAKLTEDKVPNLKDVWTDLRNKDDIGVITLVGPLGIGYRTDKVKVIKVSKKTGEPSVEPTIKTTLDKTYPIARPMFMYVPPGAKPEVDAYIKWIVSAPGQKLVIDNGYVPLPEFAPKDK